MVYFSMLLLISVLSQIMESSTMSPEMCRSFDPLAKNINDFGLKLHGKLGRTENLIMSPFSVYTAIVLVYMGARHRTATEIENALQLVHDGLTGAELMHSFEALMEHFLNNAGGYYSLESVNAMFFQDGLPLKKEYVNSLNNFDHVIVKQLNFAEDVEAAKKEMNDWVTEITHGKITNLITELDPNTKLALLSAVYFKGTWKKPFNKANTNDGIFHKSNGEEKQVKMMHMLGETFFFHENEQTGCKYLELPYKGDDIVMLLALPSSSAGDFRDSPKSSFELCDVFGKLKSEEVEVMIPIFSLKYKNDFRQTLIALGMRDIFNDDSSDLTGITDGGGLVVSHVFHKAAIDVNEEGSEAAAVTMLDAKLRSAPHAEFLADRPFLFYIVDKKNGLVLFSGEVTDP